MLLPRIFFLGIDLENDAKRVLRLNRDSRFFGGLQELEMENQIGPLLVRYVDFNFYINYAKWETTFFAKGIRMVPQLQLRFPEVKKIYLSSASSLQ
ncbi:MAG TPA: hypothetical protein ACHBX0_09085 [Arsenophonus sp.]